MKIHKRLQEIISELKRLEKREGDVVSDYRDSLEREADKLQRRYRRFNGFNYNPLMYSDRRENI